ncbi:MAG: recombinase family protein [Oscillospiraceae bacterium]
MRGEYAIYLRKSRVDIEAESRGEGNTLLRHEKVLLDLAKRMNLKIIQIYREVVSGETISARPEMQNLLNALSNNMYDGVLVMEVERLARGDTVDQGIVAQAFKFSDTKIITPSKTYDPNNEFDEEYFEFGLFMSRREYKTINRRLQRGREAAIKEGKYVGSKAPYGYRRIRLENDKGFTLEPIPEEASAVKMMFDLYTTGELQEDGTYKRLGTALLARRLNELKIPSKTGKTWTSCTIKFILRNPVYAGKIRWNCRPRKKSIVNGQIKAERPRRPIEECLVAEGLHPAIVDQQEFQEAQEMLDKNPPRPVGERFVVKNPLAGLVVCGKCGRHLHRRPYQDPNKPASLICADPQCDNVSTALHYVEERILKGLEGWLKNYKLQWGLSDNRNKSDLVSVRQKAADSIANEIKTLNNQLDNLHDLLEQGIYSTDQFLDRSKKLSDRISQAEKDNAELLNEVKKEKAREQNKNNLLPKIEKLLSVYQEIESPAAKNDLLKEVLEKVVYVKTVNGSCSNASPEDFEISIYPKLPKQDNI